MQTQPQKPTQQDRNWSNMSYQQKLEDIRKQIKKCAEILATRYGKDSNIGWPLHQLSYFIWLPVHNSLDAKNSRLDKRIESGCSICLLSWIDHDIPRTRDEAVYALAAKAKQLKQIILREEQRRKARYLKKFGFEPAQRDDLQLFRAAFGQEIKELAQKKKAEFQLGSL